MKKLIICLALLAFIVPIGCSSLQIGNEQTQEVIIEIAARNLAYQIAKKNPDIVVPGIAFCRGFLEVTGDKAQTVILLDKAMEYLAERIGGDDLLMADMMTLAKLLGLNLDLPDLSLDIPKLRLVKVAVSGFLSGLELVK